MFLSSSMLEAVTLVLQKVEMLGFLEAPFLEILHHYPGILLG